MLGRSIKASFRSNRIKNAGWLINRRQKLHTKSSIKRRSTLEEGKFNRINSKLTEQLQALEEMTKQVKETLKVKKEENDLRETKKDLSINQSEVNEEDIDKVFNSLGLSEIDTHAEIQDTLKIADTKVEQNETTSDVSLDIANQKDLMNLFPQPKTYVSLPSSVTQVLSPEQISHITREETADWEPVIDGLLNSTICDPTSTNVAEEEFTSNDFHQLVTSIPRKHKIQVVEKLHELALRSGVVWGNIHVMNQLLSLCNLLSKEKANLIVEALLNDIQINETEDGDKKNDASNEMIEKNKTDKVVGNTNTKSVLLNHYARIGDVPKVREFVAELNKLPDHKNPMKTSPVIYTSIMQMYMRLNNYELAKETFDTMKFLSVSTSPSSRTYTSMILLDTLNNNIEHGISVYEEMKNKEIKIEPQALLALAKGCGARTGMVAQGWDFVIKYYQEGYPVDSQVMETMMYLAYVDGDLPFVRGIWTNICETNTKLNKSIHLPHPKCTKWLFNTYYKVGDFNKDSNTNHVPIGLTDPRVKSIRTKVLELTNFSFHPDAPPLLPNFDLNGSNSKMMLSEARALWKYMIEKTNNDYIQQELVEAYLYVVGRYSSIEIFQQEWEKLTIFDNEGLENEMTVEIEDPEEAEIKLNESKQIQTRDTEKFGRFLRNDRLYNMCMHIARHQGSLSFAQKIWSERGRYRKGTKFQKLSITKQDAADFKFARLMLSTLTFTGNVGDAYKLVLSSQNRFVWTKYHLKSLISVCEQMGYTTFSRELQSVIKKSNRWIKRQAERK